MNDERPHRVRRPPLGPSTSLRLVDFAHMGTYAYILSTAYRVCLLDVPLKNVISKKRGSGDSAPLSAGRDIRKFESEAATWLTSTHTAFMIHAAAAAAARACAITMKKYCFRRLADDYIVRVTDDAPTPVPWPM